MEALKIVSGCLVAAVVYGVIHDQFTARVCVEYFSLFHPPVFRTQSPTLLGLGWGVLATWWVGAILGALLALSARGGSRPKLSAINLVRPVGRLLLVMGASAALAGFAGFFLTETGILAPPKELALRLAPSLSSRFMADWLAHGASYVVGLIGGVVLCVRQYQRRSKT